MKSITAYINEKMVYTSKNNYKHLLDQKINNLEEAKKVLLKYFEDTSEYDISLNNLGMKVNHWSTNPDNPFDNRIKVNDYFRIDFREKGKPLSSSLKYILQCGDYNNGLVFSIKTLQTKASGSMNWALENNVIYKDNYKYNDNFYDWITTCEDEKLKKLFNIK